MTTYHVYGHVNGIRVSQHVEAANGAEAIKTVAKPYYPKFSKHFVQERREWYRDHVRLNAKQVAGISTPMTAELS